MTIVDPGSDHCAEYEKLPAGPEPQPQPPGPPRAGAAGPVAEAAAMVAVFLILARYIQDGELGVLQAGYLGWNFLAYLLMAALAMVSLVASRRGLDDLGFKTSEEETADRRRVLNVLAVELVAIWVVVMLGPGLVQGLKPGIILPPAHFAQGLGWPAPIANLFGYLITIAFVVFFYGPAQELFYRGCIQGTLNQALGRPFQVWKFKFGWGLVIATGFYVIGQGLMIYSPQVSEPSSAWPSHFLPVITLIEGVALGLLYERAGLFAAMALHAAIGLLFFGIEFTPF